MGVGGKLHAPAVLAPEMTRYPLYRRLGGPQGRSGRLRKISPPTGIRSPDRPARSDSLYRLSYRGPHCTCKHIYYFKLLITIQRIAKCSSLRVVAMLLLDEALLTTAACFFENPLRGTALAPISKTGTAFTKSALFYYFWDFTQRRKVVS
jgi:hypothetical protein